MNQRQKLALLILGLLALWFLKKPKPQPTAVESTIRYQGTTEGEPIGPTPNDEEFLMGGWL